MIQSLEKGAKVKTVGGMFGTITGVKDDCFVIRIAENVKVEISKEAVSAKLINFFVPNIRTLFTNPVQL